MMDNTKKIQATLDNTLVLGKNLDLVKKQLSNLEANQENLRQNMIWLGNKIDTLTELINEKFPQ
jgi:hypothetical protein